MTLFKEGPSGSSLVNNNGIFNMSAIGMLWLAKAPFTVCLRRSRPPPTSMAKNQVRVSGNREISGPLAVFTLVLDLDPIAGAVEFQFCFASRENISSLPSRQLLRMILLT